MGKVVFDISVSLDGYITGPDRTPTGLHHWAEGDLTGRPAMAIPDTRRPDVFGAVLCGRRTYEDSLPSWGADGPSLSVRLPVVVVGRGNVTSPPADGIYRFVDDVDDALAQAHALAGGKDVTVMGRASLPRGLLRAGVVDEMKIHLVPILLGPGGTRLSDDVDPEHVRLRPLEVEQDDRATHIRYAVVTGP